MAQAKMKMSLKTWVLLGAAALLTVAGLTTTANAALNYVSDNYTAQIELNSLDVDLQQKGVLANGKLTLTDGDLVMGKKYTEDFAAVNVGETTEFVRATVYRFWLTPEGEQASVKDTTLDPSLIEFTYGDGWVLDESKTTAERVVLYRSTALAPGESSVFVKDMVVDKTLSLITGDNVITTEEDLGGGRKAYTTTYKYNGYTVGAVAQVDSVQIDNAADAIKSAWGVNVSVSGNTMTLA